MKHEGSQSVEGNLREAEVLRQSQTLAWTWTSASSRRARVLLLNTGGTIGMVRTDKGYAPLEGEIARNLESLQRQWGRDLPEIELLEYQPLLDSTDIAVLDWQRMAADVAKREADFDGFVILHGTDTMAYTASALSFLLQGLSKPVVLTGSQLPLGRIRSDGRENLITALLLAAYSRIPEVCLYFGGKLLRGNRSTKLSADRLVAFDSPNYPPLMEAGIDLEIFPERLLPRGEGIQLGRIAPQRLGVIKIFPGIQFSLFENLVDQGLNGLILEAFGAGNIPSASGGLETLLRSCAERQIVTVVCTQCHQGRARLGEYAASSTLRELAAVSGEDLTIEAATAKLTYLLSQSLSFEETCRLMRTSLCGEMSEAVHSANEPR